MLDTLPLELTTEIFIFTLPEIPSDPHPANSPLLPAQVCRSWRCLALSAPQLWTNLTLSDGHVMNPNTFLIEQWLGRAGLVSLSLWVNHFFPDKIMNLISRNNTKWRALEFHTASFQLHVLERINPLGGFPSLKRLVIQSTDEAVQTSGDAIRGFSNAPQLEKLRSPVFPNMLGRLLIPWAQITDYTCTGRTVDVPDLLHILVSTPNLVRAHFTTSHSLSGNLIPPLLHLKSLALHSKSHPRDAHGPVVVLRYVTLPALQTLDIGVITIPQLETLLAFLTRSSCRLFSFSASARETLLAPLIPCLQAMPTLSSLRMSISSFEEDGSRLLRRLGDDISFLPRLEDLAIVSDGRLLFPYDLLLETLRARTALVPLRRFALLWTSHPGRFYLPDAPLEGQLRETGVDIHFGPHESDHR